MTRATIDSEAVSAWVKNDHLGFKVLYVYRGVVRKYRPDFLVRFANGEFLVLEIKGQNIEQKTGLLINFNVTRLKNGIKRFVCVQGVFRIKPSLFTMPQCLDRQLEPQSKGRVRLDPFLKPNAIL